MRTMRTFKNSLLRESRPDTAMRGIGGVQACCFALPHQRAARHRVSRVHRKEPHSE